MATRRQMDLLTAVEQIVEKAQGSGLSSEFYRKAARPIKYVAEKMDLTREQSVMMSLFIENSDDTCIKISDFSECLGCRTTRIIKYMAEIDVLEKRELVRCSRKDRCYTYRVPIEVVEAFKNNEKYVPKDYSGLTCMELFSELENIFELRRDGELTYGAMVEKIHYLFSCNSHLLYVQKVKSYDFYDGDEMMLVFFSHLFVNNNDDNVRIFDLDFLLKKREWRHVKASLNCGDYPLLEEKLIEYNHDGGFVNRESFRMTDKAKRELFGELNLASMDQRNKRGDMIKTEEIVPKKLFYGNKVGAQISELGGLLDEVHYEEVRARMKATGFRCCFTCLFYGQPGTGKTETVLQLARQTGRDILQVNISEIKSMWSVRARRTSSLYLTITEPRSRNVSERLFSFSTRRMLLSASVRRGQRRLWRKWKTQSRISSFRKWKHWMEFSLPQPTSLRIWIKRLSADSSTRSSLRGQPWKPVWACGEK